MTRWIAALLAACFSLFAQSAFAADPRVEFKTTQGTIVIELNPALAPKTVENFLTYVKSGFYTGTVFHRVIDGFMIQAGGMDKNMNEKPTQPPIQNEAKNGLKNATGTIAMARRPDPHSASSQFFINLKDNMPLDYPSRDGWGYAVFGKVVDGMEVVNKIAKVETGTKGLHENVPMTPIVIESAKLLADKK